MEIQEDFLSDEAFRGFESFRFPSPLPRYPTPPESSYFAPTQPDFYNTASPYISGFPPARHIPEVNPVPLFTAATEPIARQSPSCVHCKGHRYGFSAYFHNPKLFSEPPHHLLHLVEQSYFLRDRLKSLLVTYAMRPLETDQTQVIENEIHGWQREVACFANHVLCSALTFELRVRPLDEVRRWATEMSKQLAEHVQGVKRLDMPKGRLQVLLTEFRRAWELVWIGFLEDERDPSAQYPQDFYRPDESLVVSQWVED